MERWYFSREGDAEAAPRCTHVGGQRYRWRHHGGEGMLRSYGWQGDAVD